MSYWT